jgi:hypothetical protein
MTTRRRNLILPALLAGAVMLCGGCAATMTVHEMGVSRYNLNVVETESDAAGRVVLTANLVPYKMPVCWPGSEGKSGPPRAKRYIVGDPATVAASVRDVWEYKRPANQQSLEVRLAPPNQPGWHVIPFDAEARDAIPAMLPAEYRQVLDEPVPPPSRYKVGVMMSSENDPITRHVAWWHWPVQVLLLPAFVFDVVTLPIQLNEFGNRVR